MTISDIVNFLEKTYPSRSSLGDANGEYHVMAFVVPRYEPFKFISTEGTKDVHIHKRYVDDDTQVIVVTFQQFLRCSLDSGKKIVDPHVTYFTDNQSPWRCTGGNHNLNKLIEELDRLRFRKTELEEKTVTHIIKKPLPGALDLFKGCRILVLQADQELMEDVELLAEDLRRTVISANIIKITIPFTRPVDTIAAEVIGSAVRQHTIVITAHPFEKTFPQGLFISEDYKPRVVKLTRSPYETTEIKSNYEMMEFP